MDEYGYKPPLPEKVGSGKKKKKKKEKDIRY